MKNYRSSFEKVKDDIIENEDSSNEDFYLKDLDEFSKEVSENYGSVRGYYTNKINHQIVFFSYGVDN